MAATEDRGRRTEDGQLSAAGSSSALRPPSSANGPSSRRFRYAIVILAAGASTRMGSPKQLLELEGQALIVRAIEAALKSSAWPVIVVLGANAEKIRPVIARLPIIVAENPAWSEGMASSLRAGVTTVQQFSRSLDGVLFALCDQPGFSTETIDRLIAVQRETGRGIVAAHYSGRNGAPALFLREHFPTLSTLTGEEGARVLLNGNPGQIAAVDLPSLAIDLDTPADVASFRQQPRPQ